MEEGSLFRVWRTVLELLGDRGYNVGELWKLDEAGWQAAFQEERSNMTLHVLHRESPERQLRVLFLDRHQLGAAADGKIRKVAIEPLLKRLGDRDKTHGLFVFTNDLVLTPVATRLLVEIAEEHAGKVQWFFEEELVVNVVRSEAKRGVTMRILANYERPANFMQFPRIYTVDRLARYYNAQPGDVLLIHRRSETGAETVSMRRCIALVDKSEAKNFL